MRKNRQEKLWTTEHGNRTLADFAVDFLILAEKSGWNYSALRGAFYHALNDKIKADLASRDDLETLGKLIALTIWLDKRLRERSRVKPKSAHQ